MTLKSYAKKLICCFKNDKNLMNFDLSTQNETTSSMGPEIWEQFQQK